MKSTLFKGASPILGAALLATSAAFAAPAFAVAQETTTQEQAPVMDAATLASVVQTAIDALPEDATEEQIEAAISAAVANSGADAALIAQAMVIVATNNATNPAIVIAATNVATNPPSPNPSGPTAGGAPAGDGAGAPPPPAGGAGGNSDY